MQHPMPTPPKVSLWHLAWRQMARDFRAGELRHAAEARARADAEARVPEL